MKECDNRNSHISSELHVIYISAYNNDRYPVTNTFTPLHYTSLHLSTLQFFSFKLHPSTVHLPSHLA